MVVFGVDVGVVGGMARKVGAKSKEDLRRFAAHSRDT